MASKHSALKPSRQREGERSVTEKEHLADASTKDQWSSWAALLGLGGSTAAGATQAPSSYQKSSANPKHGRVSKSFRPFYPWVGILIPNWRWPHREDRWACQPLELKIYFAKPVSCKILRSNKWTGKWESLILPVLDVFSFQGGWRRKERRI